MKREGKKGSQQRGWNGTRRGGGRGQQELNLELRSEDRSATARPGMVLGIFIKKVPQLNPSSLRVAQQRDHAQW